MSSRRGPRPLRERNHQTVNFDHQIVNCRRKLSPRTANHAPRHACGRRPAPARGLQWSALSQLSIRARLIVPCGMCLVKCSDTNYECQYRESFGASAQTDHRTRAGRDQTELDRAYNDLRRNVVLKGFRPGHAPRTLLERFFGDQVRGEIVQKLIKEYTDKALEEQNLKPWCRRKSSPRRATSTKRCTSARSSTSSPKSWCAITRA